MALSSITRATTGGRTVRYNLKIIQQPTDPSTSDFSLRAPSRCRPVNLTPVLELKKFELTAEGGVNNITHVANANYFVFVTAEPADRSMQAADVADLQRPIALAGCTCAGMALEHGLDPSGRFVFPGLSVEYEDHFRLNFRLYEGISSAEDSDAGEQGWGASSSHRTYFAHRLEGESEVC